MNKASEEGEAGIVAHGWTLGIAARVGGIQFCLICLWQPEPSRQLVFSSEEVWGRWHPALSQTDGSLR